MAAIFCGSKSFLEALPAFPEDPSAAWERNGSLGCFVDVGLSDRAGAPGDRVEQLRSKDGLLEVGQTCSLRGIL